MIPSFHNADRPDPPARDGGGLGALLGVLAISFWLRPQSADDQVLVKADRLMRTAGEPSKAR